MNTNSTNDTAIKKPMKNSEQMKLPTIRKIHLKPGYVVVGIIALLLTLFFARVAIWENAYLAAKEGSERDVTTTTNSEVYDGGEEVDNTEPTTTEITEYIVAADKPRYFSIPSLGINNARVVELGLKSDGSLASPYNIYNVGWYTGSSLPGTNGVAVLDAHGGDLGSGIFRTLPRIQIGALVRIEMGDGRLYTYRVVDTATKELGEDANNYMPTAFTSPQAGVGSITLITCTGDWWLSSQTYSQRFFVRAVLER